jgi:DNA polymerase-3 subunit gamma/tau
VVAPVIAPIAKPEPKPEPKPIVSTARAEAPPMEAPPPWLEDMPSSEPPPYAFPDAAESRVEPVRDVRPEPRMQAAPVQTAPAQPVASETIAEPIEITPAAPVTPIEALNWDGHWPSLAASLPVRGIAHQLAQQSELLRCEINNDTPTFHLRVAVETLLASGSVDKLMAALSERFGRNARVTTEIGTVQYTANAAAVADREALQKRTEETFEKDPFILKMFQEFGATIMPGSVRPAQA